MLAEAFSFLAGVVAKAIADHVIKGAAARFGALDYIKRDCGFFVNAHLEDGRVIEAVTRHPELADPEARSFVLTIRGELLNDSGIQRVLLAPAVMFVHTSGRKNRYVNPILAVAGKEAASITLPPHSATPIAVYVTLPRKGIADNYAQTLPILEFPLPGGKRRLRFRASGASFYGDPTAFWPKDGDIPIVPEFSVVTQSSDAPLDSSTQPTGKKPPAADRER